MDEIYSTELIGLGTALTQLALKGTATAVSSKVKAIKNEKSIEKVRNTYDEIINELLSEREEAVRIAQSYKSELDKVVISDDDIVHLHHTVSRLLEVFKTNELSVVDRSDEEAVAAVDAQVEAYEQIKELINVDTLKTMQLIGFNYKAAIGEPLTIMLKNFLLSKVPKLEDDSVKNFLTPEMVDVLKNKEAYKNMREIMGLPPTQQGKQK